MEKGKGWKCVRAYQAFQGIPDKDYEQGRGYPQPKTQITFFAMPDKPLYFFHFPEHSL